MPRRRVPTVGAKDLNVAQLSPEVRKILAKRSRRAARREYAPVLAADRAAFGAANAAYRSQAKSVRGATGMVESTLAQALQSLKGSGLKGGYLKQVARELTSRQGDAAAAIPFLLADAASERAGAIQDARMQLISDRASMKQSSASKFNQALKEGRSNASSVLGDRKDDRKPSDSDTKSLANAALALQDFINHWKRDPKLRRQNPLGSQADWVTLAHGLDSQYQGFGLNDAMKVIKRLRKRWENDPELGARGTVFEG